MSKIHKKCSFPTLNPNTMLEKNNSDIWNIANFSYKSPENHIIRCVFFVKKRAPATLTKVLFDKFAIML